MAVRRSLQFGLAAAVLAGAAVVTVPLYLARVDDHARRDVQADDTNNDFDACRIDVATGAIVRASLTSDGVQAGDVTGRVAMSGDGNRVGFPRTPSSGARCRRSSMTG